jgi:cytosine permease
MATQVTTPATPATLPDYLQAAKPNPITNRAPWYKNTAPTYAGVFLWFVFWDQIALQGLSQGGLAVTLLGILLAGLICHFLFYLVPGLLGMKTGLPLYIVGTSTFGAVGGLLMPGFLMGLLQFGWLGVNTFYSCEALDKSFSSEELAAGSHTPLFYVLCVVFAAGAAFIGLKGIQYVAKVATYLPLIPLAVLVLALVKFAGSAGDYKPAGGVTPDANAMTGALLMMVGYIVGFFATAGAAGVDFGQNSRDKGDVQWGGIVGILVAILITAGVATIAVAGAHAQSILQGTGKEAFKATNGLKVVVDGSLYKAIMIGLTIAAFPGACFSSFIAANSFKTVMPRVNSFLSVGLGALVSILLAVTGLAENLEGVFGIIGASFGPICGAMCVDYLLAGRKWAGPRAGFNPAGWVAWLLGFVVGIMPNLHAKFSQIPNVPAASVAAFIIGAVVYFILAKAGLESRVVPYGPALEQKAA